ncbi:MAG: SDR family NAD(P)-dependent oxidoreductase [Myxococcota bacterium]|jgi:3-oxoacyl-[acyl-carrier protein] reductase
MSLDGKVAVVTGAAHGLGRIHALGLAAQGAKVVVNDLGVAVDGSGRDEAPAQNVVDEIKAAGGEAVAHFGDVADWESARGMIGAAVETFGDFHILVNNAGFTRDATLFNMTEEQFDSVVRVHLKGHFCPTKFAANYWRQKSKSEGGEIYGRLLATASESYFFTPPGQPNYSAAKAGIVSMTIGASQLLAKYGVTANIVLPRARTRMTLSGATAAMFEKPDDGFDHFAPENASPLFVYLASPEAKGISGHVFVVWGREVCVVGRPDPKKKVFQSDEAWTLGSLHDALGPFFAGLDPVSDTYSVPPM